MKISIPTDDSREFSLQRFRHHCTCTLRSSCSSWILSVRTCRLSYRSKLGFPKINACPRSPVTAWGFGYLSKSLYFCYGLAYTCSPDHVSSWVDRPSTTLDPKSLPALVYNFMSTRFGNRCQIDKRTMRSEWSILSFSLRCCYGLKCQYETNGNQNCAAQALYFAQHRFDKCVRMLIWKTFVARTCVQSVRAM